MVVGDAIANFLCIEEALAALHLTAEQWANLYKDLRCKNVKVAVKDRTKIKVVKTEDRVLEPAQI